MFSVDPSLALAAFALPASRVVSGRTSRSGLPRRRARARQADPTLPRNRPEIEIIWLVLADETTPVPQREIVVPLFDNIFDHRKTGKRIDMSKDWIAPTSRNGTKRYVQVKHISCFGAHQDGYTFIGIAGDLDPIQVRETPEEICALLGITNDGSHTTSDPALDIAHDAAPRSAPR